jgi:hypothetical protein
MCRTQEVGGTLIEKNRLVVMAGAEFHVFDSICTVLAVIMSCSLLSSFLWCRTEKSCFKTAKCLLHPMAKCVEFQDINFQTFMFCLQGGEALPNIV